MPERLKDKVAIVVGADCTPGETIGNGRATAILFAREGGAGPAGGPRSKDGEYRFCSDDCLRRFVVAPGRYGNAPHA